MEKNYIKPLNDPDAFISIDDIALIPIIIGKSGFYFKNITEKTGVDYIWFDNDYNKIFIWGGKDNTTKALKLLNKHILFIQNKYSEN